MFERDDQQFKRDVRRIKKTRRAEMRADVELSVDYLRDRQLDDVEAHLLDRFPRSQAGSAGQEISAVAIPLTQRFISESATLYNRGVRRWFTDADGEEWQSRAKAGF
jgi:hypothetical protein